MNTHITSSLPKSSAVHNPPLTKREPESAIADPKALIKNRIYLDGEDQASKVAISAYKRLRTSLLLKMHKLGASSTLVTGVSAGVGKTTISINLAINLARHASTHVLLVDLDLRGSSMATMLGIKNHYGIERVGERNFSLPQAGVKIGVPRLTVFPCMEHVQDSTELLLGKPMRTLIEGLKHLSSPVIVVFDSPPILGCDDVRAIAPLMESALIVVEEGETRRQELLESVPALGSTPLVGVVLNKSSTTKFSDYYY